MTVLFALDNRYFRVDTASGQLFYGVCGIIKSERGRYMAFQWYHWELVEHWGSVLIFQGGACRVPTGGRNGIRPGCISVTMTYAERQGLQADSKSASQWVEKQEDSVNKQTVVISSCADDE